MDKAGLDAHITGNGGEDSVPEEPEEIVFDGVCVGHIEHVPPEVRTDGYTGQRDLFYAWEPGQDLATETPSQVCSTHREAWRWLMYRAGVDPDYDVYVQS